jgi:histidinol-phosphatase (PHP family)
MEKKAHILINFHIHSTGSDGQLTPEEVVKEALAANIKFMCFTDHYPRPKEYEGKWLTKSFHSEEYKKEIKRVQEIYKSQIDISFGVEMDWFQESQDWIKKEIKRNEFDYVLGSVHKLPAKRTSYSFDFGKNGEHKFAEIIYQFGSIEEMIKIYYTQLRLMIKSGIYDCVGHFDYIKRHNIDSRFFSEDSDFYKKEVLTTLDLLAKSGMAMEINLRGLTKSPKAQYPSLWILKEARKRNIPLTIGSDAYNPGQVGDLLEKGYELAKQAGYSEIVRFKARKRISVSI